MTSNIKIKKINKKFHQLLLMNKKLIIHYRLKILTDLLKALKKLILIKK